MNSIIYKIKDSVDLFLSDGKYIMAYYMNTRQRKSFKVNKELIYLLENIDGKKTLDELHKIMEKQYGVDNESVDAVIELMISNKIITKINYENDIMSSEDMERYSRQVNYFSEFLGSEEDGMYAQKKIFDTHVLIFGCGAVGGNIALQLAMAGIREITLYDFDKVEQSDVSRHMYFTKNISGENKVEALKHELQMIDSRIAVHTINRIMKPEDYIEDIIINTDFVVNTLDEPYIGYTSSKISRICVKHKIPHYIAGGFDAHLASTGELIVPYITPCVECYTKHFKEKLKDWKPKKHPVKTRYKEIGGLAAMSLFSSSFAAIEIIKYIAGLVEIKDYFKVRGELLFNDMSLTYLDVKKNPECLVCGGNAKL